MLSKLLQRNRKAKGYGIALILVFLATSVAIVTSLQLMSGPITAAYLGSTSQNNLSAQQLAQTGLNTVVASIQNLYNTGTVYDNTNKTSYSYSSSSAPTSLETPQSPDALTGAKNSVGSYTGSIAWVNGNSLLVKVVATVNGSSATATRIITLTRGIYPLDNVTGATVAYGLRRLKADNTSISTDDRAIRVRRASDNAETDIGFLPSGDLDVPALLTFLNDGLTTYPKPLDRVSGAMTAYGLRKLRTAYTGNAITVRRSSDDTTTNIGFLPNGDLDTQSLLRFCGSSSCYVTTWFDQSGNSRNLTQSTATAQPLIVDAGSLEVMNGRVSVWFDGADDVLVDVANTTANSSTSLLVAKVDSGATITLPAKATSGASGLSGQRYLLFPYHGGATNAGVGLSLGQNGAGVFELGDSYMPSLANVTLSPVNNEPMTVSFNYINKQPFLFLNGKLVDVGLTSVRANLLLRASIGGNSSYGNFKGFVGELVQYTSALSTANRQILENDEARYYNLTLADQGYTPPLSIAGSATAAFGLRKLRGNYGGSAIQVRRESDNNTLDIGFDNKGNLDVVNLLNFCGTNSCFVRTWYDQSGSNNATQTTAANQPRIVNAGTLETQGGRPTIRFVRANSTFMSLASHPFSAADGTFVGTVQSNDQSWARIFDFNNSPGINNFFATLGNIRTANGGGETGLSSSPVLTSLGVYSFYQGSGTAFSYRNGNQLNTAAMNALNQINPVNNWLGRSAYADPYLDGSESEMIFYASALPATDRQLLENNQMAYYNVSSGMPDTGFITTWYDQSGNNYHLTQTNASLQPTIRIDSKSGRPIIHFNGLNNYMTTANTLNFNGTQATAFAVANMTSSVGAYGRLFSGRKNSDVTDYQTRDSAVFFCRKASLSELSGWRWDTGGGGLGSSTLTLNKSFQATSIFDGSNHTMRLNGVAGSSSPSSGNFGINQFWLGLSPHTILSDLWAGTISEVILYPSNPTPVQITQMERDQRSYHGLW